MAVLSANFELGADGDPVLDTDPGDATAWDVVNTNATIEYDNTHALGDLSGHFLTTGAAGTAHLQWTTAFGTQTEYFGRCCMYRAANPGSALKHVSHLRSGGTGFTWYVAINASGKIEVWDQVGSVIATSTASIPLGQWFRVEWHINNSTGLIEVLFYDDATSSTLTETVISTTGAFIGADTNGVDFGIQALSQEVWMDSLVDNAASYPGPVATAPANTVAPVASGTPVVGHTLSVTDGTWTGTAPITFTYQWQRDNSGGGVYGDIGGETNNTYLLAVADLGCNVRAVVTGTNGGGAVPANSNALGPVTNPPTPGSQTRMSRLVVGEERQTIVLMGR